jgi:hypothetical protein
MTSFCRLFDLSSLSWLCIYIYLFIYIYEVYLKTFLLSTVSINIRNFLWKSKDYKFFVIRKAALRVLVLQDGAVEGFNAAGWGGRGF